MVFRTCPRSGVLADPSGSDGSVAIITPVVNLSSNTGDESAAMHAPMGMGSGIVQGGTAHAGICVKTSMLANFVRNRSGDRKTPSEVGVADDGVGGNVTTPATIIGMHSPPSS